MIMIDDWKPISTAPSGETILLAWDDGGDDYDFLFSEGELENGVWLDGPKQPDWWMYCPVPPSKRRFTAHQFNMLAALPSDPAHASIGSVLTGMPRREEVIDGATRLFQSIAAALVREMPSSAAQTYLHAFRDDLPRIEGDPAWMRYPNQVVRLLAILSGLLMPVIFSLSVAALVTGRGVVVPLITGYVGLAGTIGLLIAVRTLRRERWRAGEQHRDD